MRKLLAPLLVFILMIMPIACGGEADAPADTQPERNNGEEITLVTPDGTEEKISLEDIEELPATTETISQETDDGTEEFQITGATLEEIASFADVGVDDIEAMVLLAGDGYSVEVPGDIIAAHGVIFAYEIDGEDLEEGSAPLRAYLPGSESMYWVKNLERIELSASVEELDSVQRIYFLETVFSGLEEEYEDGDLAVPADEILEYAGDGNSVFFSAADGFEKTEDREVFAEHFLVTTGDTAPAFRGRELPRGMHVRDIVHFKVGEAAFYSVRRGPEVFATEDIEEVSGVPLSLLAESLKLKEEDQLILEATDGYEVEIEYGDLSSGVVYLRDSGDVAVIFENLPKSSHVKDLLCLRAAE
ncbi:MAG: molybdopterin-dependent oxidoreductase [Clostridia bacterium]